MFDSIASSAHNAPRLSRSLPERFTAIRRQLLWRLPRMVPQNRRGDWLLRWMRFWWMHGRRPRTGVASFNDYLFTFCTSREIDRPLRRLVSDKAWGKRYAEAVLGPGCAIPTFHLSYDLEQARSLTWPARAVVKPTHMSGEVHFTGAEAKPPPAALLELWFGTDYYATLRERNYRGLRPGLIVEPLAFGRPQEGEFKIVCWEGEPRLLVAYRRRGDTRYAEFLNLAGEVQDIGLKWPRWQGEDSSVPHREELIAAARRLAAPFPWMVRLDFYCSAKGWLCGEITNCHAGGIGIFDTPESEANLNRLLWGESAGSNLAPPVAPALSPELQALVKAFQDHARGA